MATSESHVRAVLREAARAAAPPPDISITGWSVQGTWPFQPFGGTISRHPDAVLEGTISTPKMMPENARLD